MLDCNLLIGLLKQAAKFRPLARFRFWSEHQPVRIDTHEDEGQQQFNALLMPARIDTFEV